ncbi:MAG: TonB family protein [Kofleriaceae bacterium]|nr:TonB family protein [Kofleriaceae bacterium]
MPVAPASPTRRVGGSHRRRPRQRQRRRQRQRPAASGADLGRLHQAAGRGKAGFDYFDARKSYPAEARRLGVEGKIRVRLLVDATGKVTQARLLGGLGHGLDELALARARAIEFEPALDSDDRPVASVVIWTFTFTLPSDT